MAPVMPENQDIGWRLADGSHRSLTQLAAKFPSWVDRRMHGRPPARDRKFVLVGTVLPQLGSAAACEPPDPPEKAIPWKTGKDWEPRLGAAVPGRVRDGDRRAEALVGIRGGGGAHGGRIRGAVGSHDRTRKSSQFFIFSTFLP